ncbi:MAG: NADH/ubiquinone/plastoquinone (complex I) [Sandaracinaceae bacterium]|nr:NADH/ubiquinone/plastoquinone (complex I) [Sandaracinaceae bacterium]
MTEAWIQVATVLCVAAPGVAFALIAGAEWMRFPLQEREVVRIVGVCFSVATLAVVGSAGWMLHAGVTEVRVPIGDWFEVAHHGFSLALVLDRLSLPFAALGAALVGLIGAFSQRYLHRERGFRRFYLLLSLFGLGVELVVLAGSLDLVFFGWELVGLTSALLIAFFDERAAPVRHGLRAFLTYRVCDLGLMAAVVWLHHTVSSAEVAPHAGSEWAGLVAPEGALDATIVGALLVWAAMGKSAQVPLGGWLPRAMEGPTPSSAVFYGALSIHLGPYLLLRAAPILDRAPIVAGLVVTIGALTATHATFVGRVQTDIKSALAYASMTQVGLIFVEIGLGFRFLALAHIVGHACIRTLQLLRAPSILHDNRHLEQAVGSHLPRPGGHLERMVPRRLQPWLYRHALERGYFDSLLADGILAPVVRLLRGVDRVERRWIALLEGGDDKPADEGSGSRVAR